MQDAKTLLKSYIPTQRYADKCFRELEMAREAQLRSPRLDGMPKNKVFFGLERQIATIEAVRKKAEKEQNNAEKILTTIQDMIESLEDPLQKAIIKMRYVYGYTWSEIAISMDVSERTVYYAHARALSNLQPVTQSGHPESSTKMH